MPSKMRFFGAFDMLEFKNVKDKREDEIDETFPETIIGDFSINSNAKAMHPDSQTLIIRDVIDHPKSGAKSYILTSEVNKNIAYFRAGQSLSIKLKIGNSYVTRPYSISSSPSDVKSETYRITVKKKENGFVSDYILKNFKLGTKVLTSEPFGNFYYEKYRDKKNVIAVAGGSGVTPFMSMAYAIKDGIDDYNLTIIYCNNDYSSILFKDELDELQEKCNKIKVVYVLANEEKPGCEKGYISSEIISKYVKGPYSLFFSGPFAMGELLKKELLMLRKPRKELRFDSCAYDGDIDKETGFPSDAIGMTYKIKVIQGPNTWEIIANSNETILVALEKAGIKAPSKCRSGECGWCRSKLLLGDIFIARNNGRRRYVDIELNYIHPCCTYPVADCVIEIPFEYI